MNVEDLVTIDIEPKDELERLVINVLINEGRRREREEIISELMSLYDLDCCCDSDTFGSHYLSERQPDNLIKTISQRVISKIDNFKETDV